MVDANYTTEIEENRKEKDQFFKSSYQSPLSSWDRKEFKGLNYFPVREDYRFEVELKEYEQKEAIEIQDSGDNMRQYLRWGEFQLRVGEHNIILHVYKSSPDDPYIFLPIRDKTSGNLTYGAGRYLDLEEAHHKTPQGNWIIDFNLAYNPFCAYSENYVCPFVPIENWLEIPIEAGEKTFKEDH